MNVNDNTARFKRLTRLSRLMDSQFGFPGTRWRFGLDPVIGLIPVVGDLASAGFSLWIVLEARRMGIPVSVMMHMLANVTIDFAIGTIPLLGDVFDASYKANSRNIQLLHRHLDSV